MRNRQQQKIASILSTSLLGLVLATALSQQAHAVSTASPNDNSALEIQLNAVTGSSLTSLAVGLVPFYNISLPAEIATFGFDLSVRFTPPVFEAPEDFEDFPNYSSYDSGSVGYCEYYLNAAEKLKADQTRYYFLATDMLSGAPLKASPFGELGQPTVYHPHARVRVSADNPAILPEGEHVINWAAETRVSWVLDIGIPALTLPYNLYSEKGKQKQAVSSQMDSLYKKISQNGSLSTTATRSQARNAQLWARAKLLRGKLIAKLIKLGVKFKADQLLQDLHTEDLNLDDAFWDKFVGEGNTPELEAALKELDDALEYVSFTSAVNKDSQKITIWDQHPPYFKDATTAGKILSQDISLEATDFGGVRLGRVVGSLQDRFQVFDDCGRPTTFTLLDHESTLMKIGEATPIHWRAWDAGPYYTGQPLDANQSLVGDDVYTVLTQYVSVADTQPPLLLPPDGFARESLTAIDLTTQQFPLGRPKIVDLADPRPIFSNDAPDLLEVDHRYAITWQAQDASGNITVAAQENPDQYTQYVTIKTPGTNTAPEAASASADTITATAVEIALSGADYDVLDGRVDPLAFKIQDYPQNGQFEAPLLPFFIEDFRLSPVGDHETIEDNEIVRTSPLGSLADAFRLANSSGRSTLLKTSYCDNALAIPDNFVYEPSYVHVDDDGFYYVRDAFWSCSNNAASPLARISKWNEAGELLAMRDISSLATSSTLIDSEFSVDGLGWLWFSTMTFSTDTTDGSNVTRTRIYGMNRDLDFFGVYGDQSSSSNELGEHDKLQDMAVNIDDQIFYELRGFGFRVKPLDDTYQTNRELEVSANYSASAFRSTTFEDQYPLYTTDIVQQPVHETVPMAQRDGFTSVPGQCLKTTGDGPIYTYNVLQDSIIPPIVKKGTYYRFQLQELCPLATDIEVDSEGYVYIAQRDLSRILKYAPAYQDENGVWQTGAFIGWMGGCTANRQNSEGVFYNACDETLGISRGFQCSDEKCEQAHAATSAGYDDISYDLFTGADRPGAFKFPESMKMGPRDILYVADTGNSRVQRFGSDGAFAGEARSTGTGINQGNNGGFMLGNFGKPKALSVNSSTFYVINSDTDNGDNFLHVFRTLPFYDVTDHSAKIKYVSDFNFQGADSFSYIVDDGIDTSIPATVSLSVTRAFRPPQDLQILCYNSFTSFDTLPAPVSCQLDEDSNVFVRVISKDPDGFISSGDGGLDTHSFSITQAPAHGRLSMIASTDNSAIYSYIPNTDYNGGDSFAFNASDGVASAAEDASASVIIDPVPDLVDVTFPSSLMAARGFNRMIQADFSDVDENYQPELTSIDWGDGIKALAPSWVNSGRTDENGDEISPQIDFTPDSDRVSSTGGRPGTGKGMVVAGHTYLDAGSYSIKMPFINHDNAGEPYLTLATSTSITVVEATVVSAVMNKPSQAVDPDTPFDLQLMVTNKSPEGWSGLIARNTSASFELPTGMTIVSMDSNCSGSSVIVCALGDLAVGEEKLINLRASIALATALQNVQFTLDIDLNDDGPHFQDSNLATITIDLADTDGDTIVDVADAFPNDPRYAEDADGDLIADEWERQYGLDENNPADAMLDPDNDGANNLAEFIAETYPLLAESTAPAKEFRITGSADNQLGYRIAAGDINGDNYSDVVATAPGYQGQGAIVVYYGSADGAKATAPTTIPGTTHLGKALAVGDLNDDQLADIAVSSDQGVYLLMGSKTSFGTPILIEQQIFSVDQPISDKFGISLLIADIDNDDLNDLIIGDTGLRGGFEYGIITGAVHVYRASSAYWQDASPPRSKILSIGFAGTGGTTIDQHRLGDSLAVGDIDGDNIPDLMVGAAFADPVSQAALFNRGVVAGFLGNQIDWSTSTRGIQDFILYGESTGDRFGYSIASGEDIDGDGNDDLVVGAYRNNGNGAAYIYQSSQQFWMTSTSPSPVKIQGTASGEQFGVAVALTPPTAFSGKPAIMLGANRAIDDGDIDQGRADFYSEIIAAKPWLTLKGAAHDMLGWAVAAAGDVNGDGQPDYAIGAPDISIDSHIGTGGYLRIYPARSSAAQTDTDLDMVADQLDNCINIANSDQLDTDHDGSGDVCDATPDGDINAGGGTGSDSGGGGGGGAIEPLLMLLLMLIGSRLLMPGGFSARGAHKAN